MKKLIYFIFICNCCFSYSQINNFPKGKIIDTVQVDKNSKESYALFLPNHYESSKASPIVFIFDPVARGKIGITPFIKAAEKYGHILICSNNTKNGPYELNILIATRLFESVFGDFNIDENRIYTSGFSGGSRLASKIAIYNDFIQGVIACGAGLSSNLDLITQNSSFSYAGIVGNEDMNYMEMNVGKNFLAKMKISNELFVYEMKHQWPSQEQMLIAFDWLELEAYKMGIIKTDKKSISLLYTESYDRAIKLKETGKQIYAAQEYGRILRNYSRYFNLDSIVSEKSELQETKSYNKLNKELNKIFEEEDLLASKYLEQFQKDLTLRKTNLKWWKSEVDNLHKKNKNASEQKKHMLNRLLYKIFAIAYETASINMPDQTNQAIYCYDICLLIYPKYSKLYFNQIENYLKLNDEPKALDYLEKLMNTGYNDLNSIKNLEIFDKIKNKKRYFEIINNQ